MGQFLTEPGRLLLRATEVSEALGISRQLTYKWMRHNVLPTVRVDGSVRVPREELIKWVTARTTNPVQS